MDTPPTVPPDRLEALRGEIRAHLARQGDTIPKLAARLGVTDRWLRSRIGASATAQLTLADVDRITTGLGAQFDYRITEPNDRQTR